MSTYICLYIHICISHIHIGIYNTYIRYTYVHTHVDYIFNIYTYGGVSFTDVVKRKSKELRGPKRWGSQKGVRMH